MLETDLEIVTKIIVTEKISHENNPFLDFTLQVLNLNFELVDFVIHAIHSHLKVIQGHLVSCKPLLKSKNEQK